MFDENMSAFETPQSVHQWSTAVRLNPQKVGAVGPMTTIRRNILESLYSPTMDVVKFYMVGHPNATSGDLIKVLDVTFGPKEKEYLSAYHVQLEQGLRLLVSHGAITDNEMDSLRIRQLKRETLNSEPVVVTIRVHYQDKLPPGYVALMERVQSSTSEHAEKYSTDAKLLEENKKLCKELEELEAQLSERAEPTAEAKKVSKCYQYGMLGHIQSICPVTDEVRQRRRRFYGRWYKCQVVGLR
ncbi:hypothetical protein XELAEV_18021038mg [Xenopus laevis]|uniref:Paraneoplastic antigen Ma-like C-terminal domain-containing protein n=1 Tax=Xenopus laevis TaxID=8355 RepID=A0A974D9Q4_XENLA|nr:hypothetical protein XELAEV_18021038mg [Xenopus laevis]